MSDQEQPEEMTDPPCQEESAEPGQVAGTDLESLGPTPPELRLLLGDLGVNFGVFEPHEGRYFERLRELLAFHGVVDPAAPLDRTNFAEPVSEFQRRHPPLTADGRPGPLTLFELQRSWARQRGLKFVAIDADPFGGGLNRTRVRSDVAVLYNALREEIKSLGGILTSSGAIRDLNAPVSAGRSATSIHYSGCALDLFISSGMQNKASDAYFIESVDGQWNLWARAASGQQRTVNAVFFKNGSTRTEQVTANLINVTELAAKHGFATIGPRDCFPGEYLCAEWWHLQCEAVLVPFISQFGTEMLSIEDIDENRLSTTPLFKNRRLIFKAQWF
jgi:hypothetical protein